MAVTVDFNQKNRVKPKRGVKGAPVVTGFNRYALTTARKNGQIALAVWLGILFVICVPWWFSEATQPFAIGMPLWCLLAAVGVLFVAPTSLAGKLRKAGKGSVISADNHGPLKSLITKASKIYGIDEPSGLIETPATPAPAKKATAAPKKAPKPVAKPRDDEEESTGLRGMIGEAAQALRGRDKVQKPDQFLFKLAEPSVRSMPGAVVLNREATRNLEPPEISALVVSALVDLQQGHSRRLFLLDMVPTLQPLTRFLVWPVVIYAKLLEAMWLPHAQRNTDRLSLFLVKDPDLMVAAILKDYAARDAKMQAVHVSSQDVSNWIGQRGYIGASGAEIFTQYKLGRAIHEDPPLEDRLQKLQNWAKSPEFTAAVAELKAQQR